MRTPLWASPPSSLSLTLSPSFSSRGLRIAGIAWPTHNVGLPSSAIKESSGSACHIVTSWADCVKRQGVVSMESRDINLSSDLSSISWAETLTVTSGSSFNKASVAVTQFPRSLKEEGS